MNPFPNTLFPLIPRIKEASEDVKCHSPFHTPLSLVPGKTKPILCFLRAGEGEKLNSPPWDKIPMWSDGWKCHKSGPDEHVLKPEALGMDIFTTPVTVFHGQVRALNGQHLWQIAWLDGTFWPFFTSRQRGVRT